MIGGGYAGLTAAARIGELGRAKSLTLVDAKTQFVERIRLHEIAAGSDARVFDYAAFMNTRGGSFLWGTATIINPRERRVSVAGSDGMRHELDYDQLVYAPGSTTDRWTIPGADAYAVGLDTVEECRALLDRLAPSRHVLVVGGGLTGIEAACELAERIPVISVTLAAGRAFGPSPCPGGLSPDGFDHVVATLERLGVRIIWGKRVVTLEDGTAKLENGDTLPFDECIWAAGFRVPDLARNSGLKVNASGQVVTDGALRSVSHPEIMAVGDAAEVVTDAGGIHRMSCAAGRPMGERAAESALGLGGRFTFEYKSRCISLGRKDGLIQFVEPTDRPRNAVWTGARAARWKEYICRRTLAGIGFDDNLGPPPDELPAFQS
ncbi:MAG: FAD-dependent oxidoreductase [Alphaproteobacteria bacterium]